MFPLIIVLLLQYLDKYETPSIVLWIVNLLILNKAHQDGNKEAI